MVGEILCSSASSCVIRSFSALGLIVSSFSVYFTHCSLALSKNSPTLIVGRAITGIGSAGVLAGCYTIVALAVPPEKRPAFAGILGATYGVGSVVGPMLGGVFTDRVSGGWRWW